MNVKKSILVLIVLIAVLGCIFCAGCTTPAEKYYDRILSDIYSEDSGLSQYYSSSGSATFNGVTYSYESATTDGERLLNLKLADKEYVLKGPAEDFICGEWKGEKNGLTVTFEEDGCGEYLDDSDEYGHPFFWGKEDNGTYKIVFVDNTIRTAELSLDGLKDSEGVTLKKEL